MNGECDLCAELWRQRAQAAGALQEPDTRLNAAGSQHDHPAVRRLLGEVRAAARNRAGIEDKIELHERAVHPSLRTDLEPDLPQSSYRLSDVERAHIEQIFAGTGRNLSRAAKLLEIDRSTLYSKLKKYGLK
jgi:transcriptional regulator of acetoin/glycerol metabolism